ncbi:hypothetical protein ABZW30_46955 [Kitasatospora sp. NPDC004669]|uniref:hypothetical protein n=1 Tax=Kitasatospora sp. NPDC004669 TaxID=3154555 RepID=UPI0033B6E40A
MTHEGLCPRIRADTGPRAIPRPSGRPGTGPRARPGADQDHPHHDGPAGDVVAVVTDRAAQRAEELGADGWRRCAPSWSTGRGSAAAQGSPALVSGNAKH